MKRQLYICQKCGNRVQIIIPCTAYVASCKQKGRILEKPLQMGQTLKKGRCIDVEAELDLANDVKAKLVKTRSGNDTSHQKLQKVAMKELGLKRYAQT